MRITDTNELQKLIDELFAVSVSYSLERKDFDNMFPSVEGVQAIRVFGDTVDEVIAKLKEETSADYNPEKTLVLYTGRSLTMRDLKDMNDSITIGGFAKRGFALSDNLEGAINVVIFFKGKTA